MKQAATGSYTAQYLQEVKLLAEKLDLHQIEKMVDLLAGIRNSGGRVFILGVGGSAANASHMVNDLRKICGIESYCPTDNVAELTARINDEGWESSFAEWLKGSRLSSKDALCILSVGGGNKEKKVSMNIVKALEYGKQVSAKICGIVGRDGGTTAEVADTFVLIPTVNSETVTPHAEAFQAVVWHLMVSHPSLMKQKMKWESIR